MDMGVFTANLDLGSKIACFGSRDTPAAVLQLMKRLAARFVKGGARLASGHCEGADLAWEEGACAVKPENFTVCLPWRTYNNNRDIHPKSKTIVLADLPRLEQKAYKEIASLHHPIWDKLSSAVQLLHGRNILIGENSFCGFTYLNHSKPGGGGSGQCARYLKTHNIPVVDLSLTEERVRWTRWLDVST